MSDSEKFLEVIENALASGKIRKGVNEVTKELERGNAKLVVAASDVSPKEIIMHLPILAKEKGIIYGEVSSKEELGAAAGLGRGTAAVAVLDAGKAKDILKELASEEKSEAVNEIKDEAISEEEIKDTKKEVEELEKEVEKVEEKSEEVATEEKSEEKSE